MMLDEAALCHLHPAQQVICWLHVCVCARVCVGGACLYVNMHTHNLSIHLPIHPSVIRKIISVPCKEMKLLQRQR